MGSAGGAAMEAAAHQEGSLLNKVYAMQCAQQQQQQQSTILTVVGGRMISRSAPMPLNGQQLMMQLDGLTSAMTGMSVQEVIVVMVIDDKPLIIRRQWSPQRRMTLLTAKVVEGETRFTWQAWPHMLYLPHRKWNGIPWSSYSSSRSSSRGLNSNSLSINCS